MFPKDNLTRSPHLIVVSKEQSTCPLIADMTRLGARLHDLGIPDTTPAILSYDYGRRLLVTANHADAKTLHQEDIVEIVDYNPLKDIMLTIGPKDPNPDAPLQWMIQKARHDINITLHIQDPTLAQHLPATIPHITDPLPATTIDKAKTILKALRTSPVIAIDTQGILLIGVNAKTIEHLLSTTLKT